MNLEKERLTYKMREFSSAGLLPKCPGAWNVVLHVSDRDPITCASANCKHLESEVRGLEPRH